ncbi:hypothetical protein PMKS-001950 [Pichia membranifaciens]|uniref:Uncharacterized protein n=1 Tax=Pichia membranifaciens TaxID=4926 RepID=A0A1Q2YG14_9ASCO|nr:hypothetical protein PMKS-001950 [Pichia membranifaciens]
MDIKNNFSAQEAEPLVKDSAASNSKELLNAYIYDFLLKSGFDSSAAAFFKEANVPIVKNSEKMVDKFYLLNSKASLPKSKMTMDTPQGFIYEWWQIFWDIFNARTNRGSSQNSSQYYHFINLKQKQEAMNQPVNPNQAQNQSHNQNQNPNMNPAGQNPNVSAPTDLGMQNPMGENFNGWNHRRQQEFFRYQQHQQQQQQRHPANMQSSAQQMSPDPQAHTLNIPTDSQPPSAQQTQPPPLPPQQQQQQQPQLQHSHVPPQHVNNVVRNQMAGNNVNNEMVMNHLNSPTNFARPQQSHRPPQQQPQQPQLQHQQLSPHISQAPQTPHSPHNLQNSQMYMRQQPPHPSQQLQQQAQQQAQQQVPFLSQQSAAPPRRVLQNQQGQQIPLSNLQQQSVLKNQGQVVPPNHHFQMANQLQQQQFLMQQQQRGSPSSLNPKQPQQQQPVKQPPQKLSPNKRQRLDSDMVSPSNVSGFSQPSVPPSQSQSQPQSQPHSRPPSQSHSQSQTPANISDLPQPQQPFVVHPSQGTAVQQQQGQQVQGQFAGPNGHSSGSGTKRQFLPDGVKEYGEGLRMLETDNRKKLQDRNVTDLVHSNHMHPGHPNMMTSTFIPSSGNDLGGANGNSHSNLNPSSNSNTNVSLNVNSNANSSNLKVEPGSQFAEFSNMLGQLQQNISLSGNNVNGNNMSNSPANHAISPSMRSPAIRKPTATAPSTAAPTPSSGSVPMNPIPPGNINNSKKKVRRARKNSTSVPATPKTPNNPATPTSMNAAAINNKRGRRKAPSTASTPVIKEDGPSQLKSVTEAASISQNGGAGDAKSLADSKKVRKTKAMKRVSSSTEKGAEKDSKLNTQKSYPASSQQHNGVANQQQTSHGAELRNPSTSGFNINNDAQFLGEFNSSEQFFDFGLYSTEDASEMLPDFWGDPVDRNELS